MKRKKTTSSSSVINQFDQVIRFVVTPGVNTSLSRETNIRLVIDQQNQSASNHQRPIRKQSRSFNLNHLLIREIGSDRTSDSTSVTETAKQVEPQGNVGRTSGEHYDRAPRNQQENAGRTSGEHLGQTTGMLRNLRECWRCLWKKHHCGTLEEPVEHLQWRLRKNV